MIDRTKSIQKGPGTIPQAFYALSVTSIVIIFMVLAPETACADMVGFPAEIFWALLLWVIIILAAFLKPLILRFVLGKRDRLSMPALVVVPIIEMLMAPIAAFLARHLPFIDQIIGNQISRTEPPYPMISDEMVLYVTFLGAALCLSIASVVPNMALVKENAQSFFGAWKMSRNILHAGILSLVIPLVCLALIVVSYCAGSFKAPVTESRRNESDCERIRQKETPETSLRVAVHRGDAKRVEEVLTSRISDAYVAKYGNSMLIDACRDGHVEVARVLLNHGVASENKHDFPLWTAIGQGNGSMVQLLLERGADVTAKDSNGNNALTFATRRCNQYLSNPMHCNQHLVELLEVASGEYAWNRKDCERIWKNWTTEDRLWIAVKSGDAKYLEELLTSGISDPTVAKRINAMLIGAVRGGYVEVARVLLNHGANVNAIDLPWSQNAMTPLMLASRGGNGSMVQLLLEKGADVMWMNRLGQTALTIATGVCNKHIVELLKAHGAVK